MDTEYTIVRINKYPKDHINAYARVVHYEVGCPSLKVSNMNMPFCGTFANTEFGVDEVTFVDGIGE